MVSSFSVENVSLKLSTVSEALALSVLRVKLEVQTLQSGKVSSKNAFKDKSLSYGVLCVKVQLYFLDISLAGA